MTQMYDMTGTSAGVQAEGLHMLRGLLIAVHKREITWVEFAEMAGISRTTLYSILNKRSGGSPSTIAKLMEMAGANGLLDSKTAPRFLFESLVDPSVAAIYVQPSA